MFKVNNKDARTAPLTSFWCLYCHLLTNFTPCSSVSIVNFKHVITVWYSSLFPDVVLHCSQIVALSVTNYFRKKFYLRCFTEL